jgi:putative membrane protein
MDKNLKTALIIGGVVVAILIIVPLIFGLFGSWQGYGGYGWGMMGPGMMGGFGIGGGLMFIPMIIFWGLIIWGVVALARGVSSPNNCGASNQDSALEVLKRRYARGEITKPEYEDRKKDLI